MTEVNTSIGDKHLSSSIYFPVLLLPFLSLLEENLSLLFTCFSQLDFPWQEKTTDTFKQSTKNTFMLQGTIISSITPST